MREREESRTGTSQPSRRTDKPARLCIHCPLPLVRRRGNPSSWKRNNPMGIPNPAPFPASSEWLRPQRKKEKRESSSRAASLTSHYVRRRRGRRATPSKENDPKGNACSESGAEDTVHTHDAEVFARKNKAGEGCDEQSGSGSCTQPERDGGNSSRDQEPGRPGSPAPKALESGRTHRPKKVWPRPRDSPGNLHKWKPPFQPGGKQSNIAKARSRKPRPGEQKKKNGTSSNLMLSEEWRPSPPVERRMAQKRRRGTTGTTVPMTRHRKEPAPSHNLQENSQARFCQLDTTTERRNQPAKSRRGLRQEPRGRGKRRPAKPAETTTQRKVQKRPGLTGNKFRSMHKASRVHETQPSATPWRAR